MREVSLSLIHLVRTILQPGSNESWDTDALIGRANRIGEALRLNLVRLIGPEGFYSLMDRSLRLARADYPFLHQIRIEEDGSFRGFGRVVKDLDPSQLASGLGAVIAYFFELIAAVIGEELALNLFGELWPGVLSQVEAISSKEMLQP